MLLLQFSPSRASRRVALVAILVVLCLSVLVAPAAAAGTSATAFAAAPPVAWMDDILGNRARMIQIACVMGAIGIFFLTRSYR
jgi:hypothetical protein